MPTKSSSVTKKAEKSEQKKSTRKIPIPITVALIGVFGAILTAILGGPLIEKIISDRSTTINTSQPQITPFANRSGDKIFFLRNNNYYMIGADGENQELIVKNPEAYISCPSVSPDGEMLLFTSDIEGHTDIYIINRDGTDLRNVTNSIGFDEVCGAWSPDQKHILFYRQYSISSDILLIDVDGKNETNITDVFKAGEGIMNTISESPWSPDATKFVFQSDRDKDFNIYMYDFTTQKTVKVTNTSTDEYKASWSPDGNKVLFTGVVQGKDYDIFLIDLTRTTLPSLGVNLTNNPAHDTDAAWSPDGTKIVFISDRNGNQEVYFMDVNGANVMKLTNTLENEQRPRWIK